MQHAPPVSPGSVSNINYFLSLVERYCMRFSGLLCTLHIAMSVIATPPAWAVNEPSAAQPPATLSGDSGPAMPAREAYTADHQLLVRLLSVPNPIPMERYFSLRLAIYDGNDPRRQLHDVQLQVAAGMSHGMGQGFAHGMQSSPEIEIQNGIATVSGMFFHMTGEWTLQVTVHAGGHDGIVSFNLPCCEQ
jgi:hypothetical protein